MKTMTCKQIGGICEQEFHSDTFEEMSALSKRHAMEMFQQGDEAHIKAMNEMRELMRSSDVMKSWMENKRKEFEALPDDE